MTSHYEVLGITKTATTEEIKIAYRSLAKVNHPDKGGNTETFQKIQIAYEILSDPHKRNQYDNQNSGGISGFPFDIFNNFVRSQQHPSQQHASQQKKPDIILKCSLSLNEVRTGITKIFNIRRDYRCNDCKLQCSACNGNGFSTHRLQLGPIIQMINQPCHNCQTSGVIRKDGQCYGCNSTGFQFKDKIIEFQIPKGVENNYTHVVEGWGEQPVKLTELAGNLLIIVNIEKHHAFERVGLDLKHEVELTVFESICGKDISIPYFDEPFILNTRKFSVIDPNKEYKLDHVGLETKEGQKGNIILKFKLTYPTREITDHEISVMKSSFECLGLL